ncbi:hypothetical protein [Shewanella sp. NKUCC06_TVS]|uniref:hypothetical protein n=1 Tax=Shewanella sp. NKUCC06_TVS TaxID=2842128 RepID=UPI00048DE91C|nr:hypothetical protein [Shewanella sp. NKUCC06_TVS]MBW3532301.1 hypothetical protein [Shewanella sp. NKUCC06_TVS]
MTTCYMCDEESTSSEHVPPKCLFPEQKDLPAGVDLRKDLITVPSCDLHNSKKSNDDEYLLYCLVMSIPSNEIGNNHFLTKIMRAIERNPSLIKKYLQNHQNVAVENMETGEWSRSISCQIDDDRFDKSLEQLSRALYFHHFGVKAEGEIGIYPNFLLSMNEGFKETNASIAKMDSMSEQLFSKETAHGENPEVFKYCAVDLGEGEEKILRLYFYEGNRVTVIFKGKANKSKHSDALSRAGV